jgi:small subunit ribosomal protein S20
MANSKSAKKNMVQAEKRRVINLNRKSAIKTALKKVLSAIENKEKVAEVQELMRNAEAQIARAKRKIFHPNTAARKIGRLAKRVAAYSVHPE